MYTFDSTSLITIVALLISLPLIATVLVNGPILKHLSIPFRQRRQFSFTRLPLELRQLIYQEVIAAERQQISPKSQRSSGLGESVLDSLARVHQHFLQAQKQPNTISSLLQTNKQICREVRESLCLHNEVSLTINPTNEDNGNFFRLDRPFRKIIRNLHVKISITPPALIPNLHRNLEVSLQWPLRAAVLDALRDMTSLQHLRITIKATGNAQINPVWLWLSVCDALLPLDGITQSSCQIAFEVEQMPSLVSSNLVRAGLPSPSWTFHCMNGHETVGYPDKGNVRKFAQGLAHGCREPECIYVEP